MHALLRHLDDAGFAASPRVIDVDDDHETLSFLPGDSGPTGWARVVDERGLRETARLLRSYHDAVRDWSPPPSLRWYDDTAGGGGPGELVCHGDFGPWNLVWDATTPVGILDWDYAAPGPPHDDVAYALEYVAPFRSDAECLEWLAYPSPPDRRRRLEVFAEAYGLPAHSLDGLVDAVVRRQRDGIAAVKDLAARGREPQATWVAEGYLRQLADRVRWTEEHRDLFV